MKYWIITRGSVDPGFIRWKKANTLTELKQSDTMYQYGSDMYFTEVSEQEYNLGITYKVRIPETNPSTGNPWIATQIPGEQAGITSIGFDPARIQYALNLIWKEEVKGKADKGQLIDDIAVWHNVFSETLIKIIIFKYNIEAAMRVKMKVISDKIAKYNLNLVIKDFKPDYSIPQEDKNKLIDGLKEIEAYDNDIYNKMAQAIGLESGALHNEVVDAYERVIQALHPEHFTGNTLAGELANSHTGVK